MLNKDEERAHLKLVYSDREFASIEAYDPFPDWILRRPGHQPFGVEVTKFFHSGTTARLLEDPKYRTGLIRGGRHRHKEDIEAARVARVEINPGGPRHFTSDCVIVNIPPLSEYASALAARIVKEGNRIVSAPPHLSHVNLLIIDREHRLGGTSVKEVCLHLLTPDMKRALIETPYREVFLATSVQDRGACFFPLRLVFLASEGFLLNQALNELYSGADRPEWDWDEELEVYGEFLRRRGAAVGMTVRHSGRLGLVFGNSGFSVDEGAVAIHDYADYPLPRTRPPVPRSERCLALSPKFVEFFDDWSGRKFFTWEFAYPVVRQA